MALQVIYQSNMGFVANEAYARIVSFTGDKSAVHVIVRMYFNEQAKLSDQENIGSVSITLPIENGATMQQMYDALKLLPEFEGAVDC